MSVVNWNSINGASQQYHEARNNLEKIDNFINKTIEENTVDELESLKKATEQYNKKIESILQSQNIKKLEQEAKKNHDVIKKTIKIAFETYKKVREIIYEKDLTLQQKKEYEKKLYEKLMEKFMTEEEKKIFEKIMSMHKNNIIIMTSGINDLNRITYN